MPRIRFNAAPNQIRRVLARTACSLLGTAMLVAAPAADAQLLRTPIPLPVQPKIDTSLGLDPALRDTLQGLSPQRLEDMRELRLRALVRAHSAVIEADPHGFPIVRREVVTWSPTQDALERALAVGFAVGRRTSVGEVGELVVLIAPPGVSTRAALKRLRRTDPAGSYDFNHLFFESGASRAMPGPPGISLDATREATPTEPRPPVRIGVIDGGVAGHHPALEGLSLHRWGCGDDEIASAHGTAVASLLAGRAEEFHGAAPGAQLFAADVYCASPTGGMVETVVAALGWLLRERVPVINISLVGPPNGVFEQVVRVAVARGVIIVAAVGNDGPAAPPAYPASYPGVIAVTAVDARRKLLPEAGRALHVDFAAPGADMLAANPPAAFAPVRGTSFAAPIVSGLFARQLVAPDPASARTAIERLAADAVPPTGPASSSRYGKGVVGEALRVPVPATPDGRKPVGGSFLR